MPNKRTFYLLSKQLELNIEDFLPKSKQFLCVEYENYLLPAESFIYKINEQAMDLEEIEKQYRENTENSIVYQYLLNHEVHNVIAYTINNFFEFLNVYYYHLTNNNIQVNKCKNCGKYFIPSNKSNETLCDNVFRKRKNM